MRDLQTVLPREYCQLAKRIVNTTSQVRLTFYECGIGCSADQMRSFGSVALDVPPIR